MVITIRYIQRFRSTPKLQGEAAYYLSSISGAIQFIETMDASSLSNITQAEFESNVESAIQALPPSPSAAAAAAPARTSTTSFGGFRTPGRDEGRERDSKLISLSPFAATAPGDEAARPLSMASAAQATSAGAGALEGTRKWFARTGNLAQEAVSKPLNAIGKIWEGMSPADTRQGSEDGSGGEGEGERERGEGGEAERGVVPRDVFGSRRFRASTPESPSRRPIFGDEGISRTCVPFFFFFFLFWYVTDNGVAGHRLQICFPTFRLLIFNQQSTRPRKRMRKHASPTYRRCTKCSPRWMKRL